jgi:hypothetical protein
METLRLEVPSFESVTHWRWQLRDASGRFLGDHEVTLNPEDPEYAGFENLPRYVRSSADPAGVEGVGQWVAERVLGRLGPLILRAAPVAVEVSLPKQPAAAVELLGRPLELAYLRDEFKPPHAPAEPLAHLLVSFVYQPEDDVSQVSPTGVKKALRMLAVFCERPDAQVATLRDEMLGLTQLRDELDGRGRLVHLRTLAYGNATRDALREALEYGEGWDIVHLSGYDLREGVRMRTTDGGHDLLLLHDTLKLLSQAKGRLKLVTLFDHELMEHGGCLELARALVRHLGCVVLAMRYRVGGDFTTPFVSLFYRALLDNVQPVAQALHSSLPKATSEVPMPAATVAAGSPILLGSSAMNLILEPPERPYGDKSHFDPDLVPMVRFPSRPEPGFAPAIGLMERAGAALRAQSPLRGVLLHGPPEAARDCALELAYEFASEFGRLVWYECPILDEDDHPSIKGTLSGLGGAFDAQLSEKLEMAKAVDTEDRLANFLPTLTGLLGKRSALVVLNRIQPLLTADGAWRDPLWGKVVRALLSHNGQTKVILVSRHPPRGLGEQVLVEPIPR